MQIHHDLMGAGNGGPTVLLSSGLGGSAHYWKRQVPALVARGYRVIVYDQLATNRSRPADLPQGYAIADMAEEVVGILDETATRACHFVGHALGGLVGLSLALNHPARVNSLSLVNAWASPNSHSARCFDARLALLASHGPAAYVQAQPIFLYPGSWAVAHEQEIADEVAHAIESFPGEDTMRRRIAALRAFDVMDQLGRIDVPVWISAAIDDALVPWVKSSEMARALPRSSLEYMPQGGHAHNITRADAFNASLLQFLAGVPETPAHAYEKST